MLKIKLSLKKIIHHVFPFSELNKANTRVRKSIKELEDEKGKGTYISEQYSLKEKDLAIFQARALEDKKALEDKAKLNVVGITISVSLIIGLAQLLQNDISNAIWFKLLVFGLAFFAMAFMIIATLLSLQILIGDNRYYELFPQEVNIIDSEKVKLIKKNIELNVKYNCLRNNYLYVSYECIRNSLVSLCLLFFCLTIPAQTDSGITLKKLQNDQNTIAQNAISMIKEDQSFQKELLCKIDNYYLEISKILTKNSNEKISSK
jgi:hypothetical protein